MFVAVFISKRKKISKMFEFNAISWSTFLLYDFVICIIIDLVLVLFCYLSSKKEVKESTNQIRHRKSASALK